MTVPSARNVAGRPYALGEVGTLARRLAGKPAAVFLGYDGALVTIVDRPEGAVISERMHEVVRGLAHRCSVCVVSGRDRAVAQRLMGMHDLVVAGSQGFDICNPDGGAIEGEESAGFDDLLDRITDTVRAQIASVPGAVVEPKKSSVAVHDRLVDEDQQPRVKAIVAVLAGESDALRVTPGEMVYEIQPRLERDVARAVLYLLEAPRLDRDDVVALGVGDDITDEGGFQAARGRGIGNLVADPSDPDIASRGTAAEYVLRDKYEVAGFLDGLAQ